MNVGLNVHSWLKCCFTFTETVGLLGTGAQDGHLDFHTAPERSNVHRDHIQPIRDGGSGGGGGGGGGGG